MLLVFYSLVAEYRVMGLGHNRPPGRLPHEEPSSDLNLAISKPMIISIMHAQCPNN